MVYFNTGLVQNLGHINVVLELWAQVFKENLGSRRLAIKLEGTQDTPAIVNLKKKFRSLPNNLIDNIVFQFRPNNYSIMQN